MDDVRYQTNVIAPHQERERKTAQTQGRLGRTRSGSTTVEESNEGIAKYTRRELMRRKSKNLSRVALMKQERLLAELEVSATPIKMLILTLDAIDEEEQALAVGTPIPKVGDSLCVAGLSRTVEHVELVQRVFESDGRTSELTTCVSLIAI